GNKRSLQARKEFAQTAKDLRDGGGPAPLCFILGAGELACTIQSWETMIEYQQLLRLVLEHGKFKADRTGTGTYSIFGAQARFPLSEGFPLVTTKKLHVKSIIYELLWFLKGDTNTKYLNEHGVTIWDEWANAQGDLGRIYGAQWCEWRASDGRSINQIDRVIEQIQKNPDSRRLIVSAWNVGELEQMALPPCHT